MIIPCFKVHAVHMYSTYLTPCCVIEIIQARIADLEDYNEVLRKLLVETEKKSTTSRSVPEGKDPTPKSTLELERVITAMKKVIG